MRLRALLVAAFAALVMSPLVASGQVITSVTDEGSDAAITNSGGITTGVEATPFGEDAFSFRDRTHQYNGARFTSAGVLTNTNPPVAGDVTIGLPSYLIGGEYISTLNGNRDNAAYKMHVTVNQPARVYLLLDNRIGENPTRAGDGPTLGNGIMDWVLADGFSIVNTGISPNGQPDFGAIDEGGTITDFSVRSTTPANLGTGPGNLINNYWAVYTRDVPAGTFTLQQQNSGGINMYGVVVTAVPEPGVFGLLAGAGLLALRRRVA
jgi:hypothetical protein